MKTEIVVSFPVPEKALKVLALLRSQNAGIHFEVDELEGTLMLFGDVLDFAEYAEDWDEGVE